MEVINDLLGYDGLKIYQNPEMFSFSIDSMILGYFATINKKTNKIIDLCTGNAPIPLYLTLRTKAHITGVEIQKKVYELGCKSVKINNKEESITLLNEDLKGISERLKETFDLVTCNPPFFKYEESSNINKSEYKTIARHEVMVKLEDCILEASKLLSTGGYFAMVHRPDRLAEIFELMKKYKIEPKRLQFIYPKLDSEPNHILIEGIKDGRPGLKVLKPLIVYENGKWTKDILEIYNLKEE
ncbi:MAG: tRNA1(Val) (adenine(37)-N6)-methyltransferase [Acholeplasmatales bacterium]|nr:tRNA1(Val) (adenine(37)-N6)-methyltransferase [Acholeplasmatales bacterium]